MTGFALGDKFIGVSTDNIYTKQELDTKLQDKQNTLIAGQGININEDGTISANTNLDVSNPLELAYPQLPNHGISLNDDGTFRRVKAASNLYTMPYNSASTLNGPIDFSSSNLNGQSNNTIPINNYDGAYSQWEAEGTITHELLRVNSSGNNVLLDCFVFGTLEDNIFTMKAKLGFYPQGASVGSITTVFTQGTWDNKIFNPTSSTSGGTGDFPSTYTGENYYMKFGLNDSGNYAVTIYDKATDTPQVSKEYTYNDSALKPVLETCNCVLLPFGYVGAESSPLHYDPEYNKVLSSTGTELWTATIPNTSVTPTLQLNYDSTLTLNGDNLGVNTSNLGLATVATTGSYTDLTNTPEEYVLPTASTDTLGGVKVDGTSIVIADGVISTNTGTGVDTYTKVEVNNLLSAKQDTITPSSPLSITKEVRSNLEGFQYTTDSTGVYTTGNYYWSSWVAPYQFFKSNNDLPGTTLNPLTFTNKIIIPYTFGQVVKLPSNREYSPFCFGKILNDGTFIPIYQPILNSRYIVMSDIPITYGGTYNNLIQMSPTDTGKQSPDTSEQLASDADYLTYTLIQMLLDDTDGSLSTNIMNYSTYTASQGSPYKGQYSFTQANYVNRLKEINCIIIAPTTSCGRDVNTAIPIVDIALYANPGNLYNLITSENYNNIDLGENLFDLSGEQAYNYLDLSIDNTLKINENSQLSVNTDSFATSEDLANKLDITKCTDIPVGLEHSISDGVLSVQTGYVKSANGQLEVTEPLTTADISNVQTGADNGVILGDVTTQRTLEISEKTGKYLFFAGTDANQQNNMVEDNRGSWIFASSSQGKNSTTCPYYGFIFNEEQPAGNYSVTINIISGWIDISLAKGTIGNLTNLNTDTSSAGIKTFDFEVSEPFSTIYVFYGNYYNFQVAYDCKITQTVSATEFSTYLCVKDGTQSIKLLNDTTELASYTDYAKIGKVIYDVTLANPTGFPSQDLANKYLSGGLEVPSLDNVITNKTLKNYIKQGDNVTITPESDGSLTISSTGGSLGDNVITSDNISQNEYIKQLEQRIAALEALIDGGNSSGISLNLSPTPAPQVNDALSEAGYVGVDTVTVEDGE